MNADLLEALRLEAATRPEAVVDLLVEGGATLAEVLLLYAGNPPEWDDGIPQQCLAEWLARHVPKNDHAKFVATVTGVVQGKNGRWYTPDRNSPDGKEWAVWGETWQTEQAARRYLKRRVLSLFPEITRTREFRIPEKEILLRRVVHPSGAWSFESTEYLDRNGFRRGHKHETAMDPATRAMVFTQTLAAPDWIPPHEEERARDAGRGHMEQELAAMLDRHVNRPLSAAAEAEIARLRERPQVAWRLEAWRGQP